MAQDPENEAPVYLMDMNGNALREGDLVMVLLEKPMLVGFVAKIEEPSVLTKEKRPGVLTVTGTIRIPFVPRQRQALQQTAKLVNPAAEQFVNQLADKIRQGADASIHKRESGADGKATGPTLVDANAVAPEDESPSAS